ncbi:WD40 repeat domain-containing serine/threonine protein kinase [Actinoallomurus soli]|uniref:WD40 repeat domain-containing serine/threonine protein kinase n=1 Tax=Actinoallomurus soli TaxID=2952535 RepID=UPI0020925819|nr:serine/threonine-protein kinase [Actinoallomurus soli]MCO5970455.1 serine/threonine protein kinase [Actinoallomurus soli]
MGDASGGLVGGRYRLTELVGRGGMGRVWRGYDEFLRREVAVKEVLLSADLAEPDREQLARRAIGEARAAARLHFLGIVTVYDVVEQDSVPWIIMQFVPGPSLGALLTRDGVLTWARTAAIGAGVAEALAHAHAAGVVHRDLKPDNVLLAGDRPVITDFGIARILDETTRLTSTHTVVGTPQYMSPEQLQGQEVTAASDLWSLGATLFAAIEGRPPFDGPTLVSIITAVLTSPAPTPRGAGPLADLIVTLLDKDPQRRPDAQTVARRLREIQRQAEQTVSAPAGTENTFGRSRPQLSRRSLILGGVGAAVVAGGTTAAFLASSSGTGRGAGFDTAGLRKGQVFTLPGYTGGVNSVAISHDGRTLAAGCDDATVRMWDLATRQAQAPLIGHTKGVNSVAFSPDGKTLASGSGDTTVRVWDLATRTATASFTPNTEVYAVAFSPDGKSLASTGQVSVALWDVEDPENQNDQSIDTVVSAKIDPLGVLSLAFSPDGKDLAVGGFGPTIEICDVSRRTVAASFSPGRNHLVNTVVFSPDGKLVASCCSAPDKSAAVSLWDATTHAAVATLPCEVVDINSVAFSPDGKLLAATTPETRQIRLWDVASRAPATPLAGPAGAQGQITFSPDGRLIASGGTAVRLWVLQ